MKYSIQWVLTSIISFWRFGSPLGFQLPKWELTWECESSFVTLSHIPRSMRCDSRASLSTRTFASPCFGCKPKAKVVTFYLSVYYCFNLNIENCFTFLAQQDVGQLLAFVSLLKFCVWRHLTIVCNKKMKTH